MRKTIIFLLFFACLCAQTFAQRKMEYLDRGLVAVKVSGGVYLSWRILGTDPSGIGFNIYRGTTKVNSTPVTGASNLTDASGTTSSSYTVYPVISGVEQSVGGSCTVWSTNCLTIQLQQPTAGSDYTYSPNDCSVGDVDGDGQWEIIVKWDPSNSKDNSQSGKTGKVYLDCYELSGTRLWRIDLGWNIRAGAHYTQLLVGDYNVDGKAEVACKTAPGTVDGTGAYLSNGPAASDDDGAVYRNSKGYILTGPEYLTIFNGQTGKEMATVNFNPARGTVSSWGDSYGNRVDRFLATNAYLDGTKPSIVYCRGYYTRMTVTAWDWNGSSLAQRWYYNAATKGSGGYGQGNHNWACGDVDSDGKDEIIHGSCAIDHDGSLMYRTGLGHGDAIHFSDFNPDNAGLEVWEVHEETGSSYGYELHDAKTGKILWGTKTGTDNGRGNAGDVDASSYGQEMWSAANYNTYTYKGAVLSTTRPSYNFRVYWDGDLQDELLDNVNITKWTGSGNTTLVSLTGKSCNTTKATPNLSADIIGDWREEVILHDGASKLYLYTTTTTTTNRMYTLMHDPVYRNAISWQNAAYNQPPHLGFWLGKGVASIPTPNITLVTSSTNKLPVINISSPSTGATYTAPASVTFTATASDPDGSIARVDYYNGSTLIGSATTSPYTFTWTSVAAGTYTITAKATDNKGAVTTSSAITVKVNRKAATYVYVYDNSGNYAWENTASWTPAILPVANDTAIIRTGEVKVSQNEAAVVRVEPSGIFRLTDSISVPDLRLQGGTLKSYTSNPVFILTSTVAAEKASTIMVGSVAASTLQISGTITGSGNLTKTSVGILQINATATSYKGIWDVTQGVLRVRSASALGACGVVVDSTATLDVEAAASTYSVVIKDGGILNLDNNLTVQAAVFGNTNLAAGTYNSSNLSAFITGTGTLTVSNSLLVASGSTTIPLGGSVTLQAQSGTSYAWYNGATSVSTATSYAATAAGSYTVKTTTSAGCSVTSAPVVVSVSGTNISPVVTLNTPLNNQIFYTPATVELKATATDEDGTVSKVEFFHGTTLIGTVTSSIYTFSWANVAVGTYSITARATDNYGATTTTAPVTITVAQLPLKYIYVYDNSGNYLWSNTNSWTPKALPTSIDTAVIRTGEVRIAKLNITEPVYVETNGILRLTDTCSVSNLTMQGGTLKVHTSNPCFQLTTNVYVENPSTFWAGSVAATVFELQGTIAGSSDITKTYPGILRVKSSAATFKGTWNVTAGVLQVRDATALGVCGVVVDSLATLDVEADASTYSLVLKNGAVLNLDSNLTVQAARLGNTNLTAGIYTSIQYPGLVTGTGMLTVLNDLVATETLDNGSVTLSSNAGSTYEWSNGTAVVSSTSSFTTAASGNYSVSVTDANGCSIQSAVDSVVISNLGTLSIPLKAGWNLISINVHPADSSIDSLFKGLNVLEIKSMESFWRAGQSAVFNSMTVIEPVKGYWVNMNVGGTLAVTGTFVDLDYKLTDKTGWQLLGCPYQSATSFSFDFDEAKCVIIKNFDGFWIPDGVANSIQNCEPGKGYFIQIPTSN